MKRALIGILIIAVVVAAGVGYKAFSSRGGAAASGAKGSGDLVFAKAARVTLPPVSGYQLSTVDLGDGAVPVITVPLDTWGGYAALFAANKGAKPNKESLFYKRGKFAVQLVREETTEKQLEGYASGKWPIIWTQMDGLPLFLDAFKADKRVSPEGARAVRLEQRRRRDPGAPLDQDSRGPQGQDHHHIEQHALQLHAPVVPEPERADRQRRQGRVDRRRGAGARQVQEQPQRRRVGDLDALYQRRRRTRAPPATSRMRD